MVKYIVLCVLLHSVVYCEFDFNRTPVCVVYTPNSILVNQEKYIKPCVADRSRLATCTSASWFHGDYVGVLNYLGRKIITYKFNSELETFDVVQEVNNDKGATLYGSIHMTFSPDETLLAVTSESPAGLTFYGVDNKTHLINPTPIFAIKESNLIHNVRFSPDGNYVAYASFDDKKSISIHQVINNNGKISVKTVYTKISEHTSLKAKAVQFTQDGKYVIIVYSPSVGQSQGGPQALRGLFLCYAFDGKQGSLGRLVSQAEIGGVSIEDMILVNDDTAIVVSDQVNDALAILSFDPRTGQIYGDCGMVKSPETQLSFPHGLAVSPDGYYFVVCNFGDDKFNLYRVR